MSSTVALDGGPEFARAMGPVARELLGDPNEALSSRDELRFGNRGSMSVHVRKGTWHNHEAGSGGGVLDLVQERKQLDKAGALGWLQERGYLSKLDPSRASGKRQVAAYDYTAITGELLFQVVRFEPKDFRQRQPDGNGGWLWKMQGVERVLYRLPEVTRAALGGRPIYVTEGEKSADALAALGFVATCSPGGAGKWRHDYSASLAGADVVILPDNDEPGREHAVGVAATRRKCPHPGSSPEPVNTGGNVAIAVHPPSP